MAKIYREQATVRIWRNIKMKGFIPTGHFGHAAVTISGWTVPVYGRKAHISFWPADYAKIGPSAIKKQEGTWNDRTREDKQLEMADLTALRLEVGYRKEHKIFYPKEWDQLLADHDATPFTKPRPGQKRIAKDDDDELRNYNNYKLWHQSEEAKIVLPGVGNPGERVWGLGLHRMALWWEKFQASNPHYQALGRQNCAGVALMALREGGSEAFVECPHVKIYTEPMQVERYARELEMQLERMEMWTQQLDADIRKNVMRGVVTVSKDAPKDSELSEGLWKPAVWKDKSKLGTFQVRSAAIREIDSALEKYHQTNWHSLFPERYKALVKLFLAIMKHRQDKAYSARTDAVLHLGGQVLALMRRPGAHMSARLEAPT